MSIPPVCVLVAVEPLLLAHALVEALEACGASLVLMAHDPCLEGAAEIDVAFVSPAFKPHVTAGMVLELPEAPQSTPVTIRTASVEETVDIIGLEDLCLVIGRYHPQR